MRLGILETGAPPQGMAQRFGDYPAMFRRLLGEGAYAYQTFDVAAGHLPANVAACDAFIVTGSSAGVYDRLPWIAPLQEFLVQARGTTPLVGICFGHQVMAQAFGGQVVKSPKGWGIGLHHYQIAQPQDWTDGGAALALPASHQDQVVAPPPGARVIGGSDFTPFGMLDYGGAISIQLHPEFEPDYAMALIEARRGVRFDAAQADQAIASYAAPDDRARVGGWLRRYLAQATQA